MGDLIISIIVIGILLLFIIFCIHKIVLSLSLKSKQREGKKQNNAKVFIVAKHMSGLPLAEQSLCNVLLCEDKIIIKNVKNDSIYNLSIEKILDVNIKSEEEIQTNYTSSIGGAVGGAVLFGPLGAMIGGRRKKKVDKICHSYLIFTYNNEKENKYDYISFDVTNNFKAHKFVDYFSKNCKKNTITEL